MKLTDIIEKIHGYDATADTDLIARAYNFSEAMHKGQRRASGEPYFVHPVEVAGIIADLKLDVSSIATALLHDTVEDTLTTIEEVQKLFGEEIATLVDGVTKISQISFTSREEKQAENFRKMVLAMARDIRVILIKLADRTHNMRTLDALAPQRQQDIAQETLDIYAPLAHRLGIYWMKSELEDNALRCLRPEVYYQLKRNVAKKKLERERYIKEVITIVSKHLAEGGLDAEVTGRPKHFYSIYQKMQSQNLLYEQIYDLVAFRVLVDSVRECYEALGVVHANWKPVPGRFKDYIAMPKANMYQSLHTTVIGPYGERMEVQIRTHEMHRIAESGIAAHWRYKGSEKRVAAQDAQRFAWLRQLLEWQQNLQDPQEFLHSIKEDLFSEEVFVFTPKGLLINLPEGSSVIDFAYRIHSEVGHHCSGARVDGKLVPLRYRLRSGDTVEIVNTASQTPSKDWLNFVKTSRAKQKIRNWLKYQQRTRSVAIGREILERDLARYHLDFGKLRKVGKITEVVEELSQRNEETLLASIGYGRLTTHQVLSKLLPSDVLQNRPPEEGALRKLFRKIARQDPAGVRVDGIEDMLVHFGRCCNPLPGERIVGFVTRGRGVTVHSVDCQRVLDSDPQRRVDVRWENDVVVPRAMTIEVMCIDELGILAAITKAISSVGVNISGAQVKSMPDKKAVNTFDVVVGNVDQLNRVLRAVGRVRGVMKVGRQRN